MNTSLDLGFAAAKRFFLVFLLGLAGPVVGSRTAQGATAPKVPLLRLELSAESAPRVATSAPAEAPASEFALDFSRSLQPPVYWEPMAIGVGELESLLHGTPLNLVPESLGFLRLRLSDAWLDQMDSDSDGLTDLLESRHPQFLSPLDPADAAADWDRDGLSNRAEAALGSDLDDFSGQLAVVPGRAWIVGVDGRLREWESGVTGPPVSMSGHWEWRQIATSGSHTLGVTRTGELWAWGENSGGELGTGSREPAANPVRIGSDSDWVQVAAGRGIAAGFSLGLRRDGSLWQWGEGLGITFPDPTSIPTAPKPVAPGQRWHCIQAGAEHAVAVNRDGSVWQWGVNYLGAFGPLEPELPVLREPAPVGGDRDWRRLVAGSRFTLGIRRNGTLWGWGTLPTSLATEPCALPIPLQTTWRWRTAAVVDEAVVAVREDGTLHHWGQTLRYFGGAWVGGGTIGGGNEHGSGGSGTWIPAESPAPVGVPLPYGPPLHWRQVEQGLDHGIGIRHDGTLWHWGLFPRPSTDTVETRREANVPVPIGAGTSWGEVCAGAQHTLALTTQGQLWSWGYNSEGQLGDGTRIARPTPVAIGGPSGWIAAAAGARHSLAVAADGTLWTWGGGDCGQLGVPGRLSSLVPMQVGSDADWVAVFAGPESSFGLKQDGSLWAWGSCRAGQVPDDRIQLEPVLLGLESEE